MKIDEWDDAVEQFKRGEKNSTDPTDNPRVSNVAPQSQTKSDSFDQANHPHHSVQVVENKPGDLFRPANEIYEKDAEKTFEETIKNRPVSPWRQWDN